MSSLESLDWMIADLDLRGYFWTGLSPCQVEIGPILPHQISFLNQNKKDLFYHFGGVADPKSDENQLSTE